MTELIAAALLIVGLTLLGTLGLTRTLFIGVLLAMAVLPRVIIEVIPPEWEHSGIADGGIVVTTYGLALVLCLLLPSPNNPLSRFQLPHIAALVLMLVLFLGEWVPTVERWSGFLHIALACLAWAVGSALSTALSSLDRHERVLAIVVTAIILIQAAAAALQLAGLRDVGSVLTGAIDLTRINGTLGHPGTLGKVLFLLVVLLLPATRSRDLLTRRISWVGIVTAIVLIGLSFGRANFAAIAVLIGLWALLSPGRRVARRVGILALLALAALPFIGLLLLRFEVDPSGGRRPLLLQAALNQIAATPVFGIGPNSYVSTVSQVDPYTTLGLPVHNSFLLALAELGIVGVILVLFPLLALILRSASALLRRDSTPAAVAVVAAVPGIVIIGVTGWGLLADSGFMLVMFVFAFLSARIVRTPLDAPDPDLAVGSHVPGVPARKVFARG
ncbi:O-antigen ligase family protein [Agromyces atrinae]|uniref:O-antigen ligase n=1 Tax=Agromyces atrinae TaxID=592376 RepID=A0A4Q2M1X4_9MICO|nr:O-antigen ligase family protein [Agromyces atrinae]NYD68529.1 O-antigen ligase [Agromyces atrinae]RXZ85914.1 O-antigen ligase domain-containing protein [Agromyces atrinae]